MTIIYIATMVREPLPKLLLPLVLKDSAGLLQQPSAMWMRMVISTCTSAPMSPTIHHSPVPMAPVKSTTVAQMRTGVSPISFTIIMVTGLLPISVRQAVSLKAVNNGLGVVCFDFNGDSYDDLFIANDGERNQLWLNNGKGNFVDRGVAFGIAVNIFGETEASMGIALGDVNGDLGLDLFLSHLDEETNTLYISTKGDTMMDATTRSGLGIASVPYTGFGTALFDADHDGDLDLAVANGRVRRGQEQGESLNLFHRIYAEPNLMMENTGSGEFQDFCNSTGPFCQSPAVSRGLLTADIDRDGDLDMLVTNSNGPVQLFQNNIPKHGGWLMLRVTELNRDAIGALAKIRTGKNWLVRPVIHTYSYLSSGDATVHFGLAQTGRVDEIEITWPDGVIEQFPGTDSNQLLIIRRGDGMDGHD